MRSTFKVRVAAPAATALAYEQTLAVGSEISEQIAGYCIVNYCSGRDRDNEVVGRFT